MNIKSLTLPSVKVLALGLVGSALMLAPLHGQVAITPGAFSYSQNFDTLQSSGDARHEIGPQVTWVNNSTILGWSWMVQNPTGRDPASYGYNVSNGIDGTAATRAGGQSYGASSSTERAMGIFTATGQIGVSFQNNTGSALSLGDITVAFAIEQWRQRSVVPVMTFAYVVSGSPVSIPFDDAAAAWVTKSELAFSGAAGADIGLDGNLAANRQSFSAVALAGSGTLGAGEYLTLRWQMTSGGQTAGGLAVDDFALQVIPEPGTWSLLAGVMALGLGLGRRRRG